MGASGNRDCALCGRHGMDTPRNQSHSRFGNERPGQVGGYWSSGGRGGLGMFCLGRPTSPKGHDRIKLKGRRSHSAWLSYPPSSPSDQKYSQACRIVAGPIEATEPTGVTKTSLVVFVHRPENIYAGTPVSTWRPRLTLLVVTGESVLDVGSELARIKLHEVLVQSDSHQVVLNWSGPGYPMEECIEL